ncbi:hypothetical protein SZN_36814 [Streptomyces zinciresistens K42]|uniref:Uncharacterized protein n=1 Tax=Streptomyces zinciresistens K42 TaxID=700597 RepID=G2GPA5_9ACTN|nr:hypothetical protein SZN_36814 [Streptomyces zinciresistens K42]
MTALRAGQRLLNALVRRARGGDERTFPDSVAVRGVHAVGEPDLRAALAARGADREGAHRREGRPPGAGGA